MPMQILAFLLALLVATSVLGTVVLALAQFGSAVVTRARVMLER